MLVTIQQIVELREAWEASEKVADSNWSTLWADARVLVRGGPIRASSGFVYYPPNAGKGAGLHLQHLEVSPAADHIESREREHYRQSERVRLLRKDMVEAIWEHLGHKAMFACLDAGIPDSERVRQEKENLERSQKVLL